MTKISRYLFIVLVVLISIFPLFFSAYVTIFNKGFYNKEFAKYGVDKRFDGVNLEEYNSQVLSYISGKRDNMPPEIFLNQREISHMQDVKKVFSLFLNLFYVLVIGIIGFGTFYYFKNKKDRLKNILKILFISGISSLGLSLIVLSVSYFGFDSFFTGFHSLFFESGTWQFYPTDNIVNVYPRELFFDISARIMLVSLLISMGIFGGGYYGRKRFIKKGN